LLAEGMVTPSGIQQRIQRIALSKGCCVLDFSDEDDVITTVMRRMMRAVKPGQRTSQ
jgi:hypothetical protein